MMKEVIKQVCESGVNAWTDSDWFAAEQQWRPELQRCFHSVFHLAPASARNHV